MLEFEGVGQLEVWLWALEFCFTDMLDEALKLSKVPMKNLITEKDMRELINGLDFKLVKKINEQVKHTENLKTPTATWKAGLLFCITS